MKYRLHGAIVGGLSIFLRKNVFSWQYLEMSSDVLINEQVAPSAFVAIGRGGR